MYGDGPGGVSRGRGRCDRRVIGSFCRSCGQGACGEGDRHAAAFADLNTCSNSCMGDSDGNGRSVGRGIVGYAGDFINCRDPVNHDEIAYGNTVDNRVLPCPYGVITIRRHGDRCAARNCCTGDRCTERDVCCDAGDRCRVVNPGRGEVCGFVIGQGDRFRSGSFVGDVVGQGLCGIFESIDVGGHDCCVGVMGADDRDHRDGIHRHRDRRGKRGAVSVPVDRGGVDDLGAAGEKRGGWGGRAEDCGQGQGQQREADDGALIEPCWSCDLRLHSLLLG